MQVIRRELCSPNLPGPRDTEELLLVKVTHMRLALKGVRVVLQQPKIKLLLS